MTQLSEKNFLKSGPKSMLCIDYGTRITGLAIYMQGKDPYPLPFGRIVYKGDSALIEEIKQLISSEDIDLIVLGIPYLTDGQPTKMTQKILEFSDKWKQEVPRTPLFLQDETLSTFEAKERMKQLPQYNFKIDLKRVDELAASIILEAFLEKINLDQSN
ncbi:MAG: Holliday junction resolvase RuvX [Bdellovibrionota bacterium]|nr:Holliday junction resolvase RuvX [Bdellovibrionota bacterium]